jgi:hypothetical protein
MRPQTYRSVAVSSGWDSYDLAAYIRGMISVDVANRNNQKDT